MTSSRSSRPSSGENCSQTAGEPTTNCPTDDEVVVERLIEQVNYGGTDHQREPPERRQYVNLDPSVSGGPHYDYGRVIYLRAKLRWRSGDQTRSLEGKRVYWQVEPYQTNRTDLARSIKHGIDSAGARGTARERTEANREGWTRVVPIYLSNYGDDKFKVRATESNNYMGGMLSRLFNVWKKLYYTLGCMNRHDTGNYSDRVTEATVVSEYQNSFIELERVGEQSTLTHQLLVEKDQINTWASANLPAAAPRTMNFALIDTLAKGAPIDFTREIDPPSNSHSITYSSGSYAFDLSAQNRWLTSAQYYDKRQPAASRTMHTLPNNCVTLTLSGLDYNLTVDVSSIATDELPLNQIHVILNLKKRDFLSGCSSGPVTIVAMRWRERNYSGSEGDATLHTMMHESGHFLGVAPKKLPDESQSDNPYYYDEGSLGVGVGPHCSKNVENPATVAELPATPECIMYHEFRLTMHFCDKCSESLRGRDLSSPSVNGRSAGY
ncbi:hypothetical protein PITCH_A290010 [uncultured Desulfobacterium sp.]|uniref:Uncharacterized protein n=1 Tax=uncultured Desulfobacterium sp. TaxID=201089 RepID=A0A445MYR5_9BACT|nr:hypothetical protein PITCH_A290010 [uncultured Desulfobacterium sp.]